MLIQSYNIKRMRQQSQSHPQSQSGYSTQSNEARKQRMDKKRAIRKNKVGLQIEQSIQTRQDKRFLTKQQKMQLQKAKNREAAQRSRDQHKKYVETLQQEIRQLRQQLSRPKYCCKCSHLIQFQSGDCNDHGLIDVQNERHIQTFIKNQNNQELEDFESPFVRMHDYEQSSSLKMFLFISMVMVGIFLINGGAQTSTGQNTIKRDLMQIKTLNNGQINYKNQIQTTKRNFKRIQDIQKFDLMNEIQNSFNMESDNKYAKVMTDIVPLSHQLSPLSQQSCIQSIIDKNYTLQVPSYSSKVVQKSSSKLRSDQHFEMQVFSPVVQDSNQNILFCSLPKLYRRNEDVGTNLLSKFIDIIISGSEVMEIIGQSPNLWMNKMINFNGIYKINAEVKQIVQIEDQNCIL